MTEEVCALLKALPAPLTLALLLLTAPGCVVQDKEGTGGIDTADTGSAIDCTGVVPTFEALWASSGVTIAITCGIGDYDIGLAETDPTSPEPWTGEDCFHGYVTADGVNFMGCHPASYNGVSLLSVGSTSELVWGETTLFSQDLEPVITYAAFSDFSGACVTWGADPDYYSGCTLQE